MALLDVAVIFGSAICAVTLGILYLGRAPTRTAQPEQPVATGLSFLFDGVDLEHASPNAEAAMHREPGVTDWQALKAGLSSRFPGLPDADDIQSVETLTLQAARSNDEAVLRVHREAGMTRVEIEDHDIGDPNTKHAIQSLECELENLRLAATAAPYPIWLADGTGSVTWRNGAYKALEKAANGVNTDGARTFQFDPDDLTGKSSVRVPVQMDRSGTTEWFSVTATQAGESTAFHAVDINAVIQAEVAQRNFVQTLAKTFAQLSIGLAIFDRNCQLALFNPALVDLTSLSAEFLSGRPDMLSFFDRLRDNRVMPEPKNYGSWRQEISEMINAASHGSYHETWTLDTGHTYRVSGRAPSGWRRRLPDRRYHGRDFADPKLPRRT